MWLHWNIIVIPFSSRIEYFPWFQNLSDFLFFSFELYHIYTTIYRWVLWIYPVEFVLLRSYLKFSISLVINLFSSTTDCALYYIILVISWRCYICIRYLYQFKSFLFRWHHLVTMMKLFISFNLRIIWASSIIEHVLFPPPYLNFMQRFLTW